MDQNPIWTRVTQSLPSQLGKIKISGNGIDNELSKIFQLYHYGMPEALAFHAGRVLEASAHQVVKTLNMKPSEKVSINLDLIASTGRIDDGYLACGNVIRRIATDARHILRSIHASEQDTVIALLQLWMEWLAHFLELNTTAPTPQPFTENWSNATPIVRALVDGEADKLSELVDAQGNVDDRLLREITTAEFLCERLTDVRHPAADTLTELCVKKFPAEKRPRQVRALFLSRNDRAHEAIETLRPILRWRFGNNSETLGILGGACKNVWLKTGDQQYLKDANHFYSDETVDGRPGYYLLINAAATSLWLRDEHQARSKAYAVIKEFENLGLTKDWLNSDIANYWLVASAAEAYLISERFRQSKELYERAKALDHTGGRWARTQQQLQVHLKFLPKATPLMSSLFEMSAEPLPH